MFDGLISVVSICLFFAMPPSTTLDSLVGAVNLIFEGELSCVVLVVTSNFESCVRRASFFNIKAFFEALRAFCSSWRILFLFIFKPTSTHDIAVAAMGRMIGNKIDKKGMQNKILIIVLAK